MRSAKESIAKSWYAHLADERLPSVLCPIAMPMVEGPTKLDWTCAKSVVSVSGDTCKEGSWVFFRDQQVSYTILILSRLRAYHFL